MTADLSGEPASAHFASEPATGDPRVDAVIAGLPELDTVPVTEHAPRYTAVHAQLQDISNAAGSSASAAD